MKEFDPKYRQQVNTLVDRYLYGGKCPGVEKLDRKEVEVQLVPLKASGPPTYAPRPDLVFIQSLQTPNGRVFAAFDNNTLYLGERPRYQDE